MFLRITYHIYLSYIFYISHIIKSPKNPNTISGATPVVNKANLAEWSNIDDE